MNMKSKEVRIVAKTISVFEFMKDFPTEEKARAHFENRRWGGSVLSTDEARFYKPIRGYYKLLVNHSVGKRVDGAAHTNGIESVWVLLKPGYHGTFHHFSKKHLDRYLSEFSFRLNQGNLCICGR